MCSITVAAHWIHRNSKRGEKEEQDWLIIDSEIRAVGELMQMNKAEGLFVLGAKSIYMDFFIAGALQSARMVDEGTFQRFV